MQDYPSLCCGGTELTLAAREGDRPRLVYAGPALTNAPPQDLAALRIRTHAPAGPEVPIEASLLNPIGSGFPGPPGLLGHRDGRSWAIDLRVTDVEVSEACMIITTADTTAGLTATHTFTLEPESGVLIIRTSLRNDGQSTFDLQWLSALCLPLDMQFAQVKTFGGKWAGEFQCEKMRLVTGAFLRESRAGRTGHASYPGLYCGTAETGETSGLTAAFHLGWSGNHRLRIDRLEDGTLSLQAGELLLPGEALLGPGESYHAPSLYGCWSREGYGDVTRRLHQYVGAMVRPPRPRPVHFNTWEAVYFDHEPARLMALADQAAAVGAERFVLDDGWFGARRSDRAGLGDWAVSSDVYPDGLEPLADHVRALGMEFGLWIEPEMVNHDSDFYRAHPDWVLLAEGAAPIPSRHQWPLDLTRPELCDYLFEKIDSLVRELGLTYLKWDMNRDIQHPGGSDGHAVMHRQVLAFYALVDRIRTAHPSLEIESCSSGGARADYGVVSRTHRVWPSDNNDARARHSIMGGAAHWLPLSTLGSHVGPRKCHITGRLFSMEFRAASAILGHMGMELDFADESESDRATLASAISLHKRHRGLIHAGVYHRLETAEHIAACGVVSPQADEALFQIAVLDMHPGPHPPQIKFAGLDPVRRYRLSCIWPERLSSEPANFAGSALIEYGLQLPQTHPDTCLIYRLEAAI
ncbi:MAG: alpha-galactosidase [Erythrobacter sp.]|nr:alpha-galactosidase [Erythrobacter sp.]